MAESEYIEFKESWRDSYLRIISAFANTHGGQLVIGINDNGRVVGVNKTKRLLEDIPNKVYAQLGITVQVKNLEDKGKEYIEIETPKPNKRFHIREDIIYAVVVPHRN